MTVNFIKAALLMAWQKNTVVTDPFFKKAKAEGYVSRAAYKLLEIQKKHKIIKPGC
jgi:23S rRNA (uridine2552-2'-O)-methyltransferase